jgi:hypothetical protein
MKTSIKIVFTVCLFSFYSALAQDKTTVKATNSDISENLDLEAVASVFGESKDLEDFEKRLNDPKTQLSNLDLNGDEEVDYLRVIETSKNKSHLVTIQAVVGKDQYQDVAVIDVEKDKKGTTQVQVVGDVYMYGPDYIITPVYVSPPVIWVWFWGPYYRPWRSRYYWGYYPNYYRPWRPYPASRYRTNVNVNINVNNTYNRTVVRSSNTTVALQNKTRKNDYGAKNPEKSFEKRNTSSRSNQQLSKNTHKSKESTGKSVKKDWKSQSEKQGKNSNVKNNKVTVPSTKERAKTKAKTKTTPNTKIRPKTKPNRTVRRKGRGRS